MNDSSLTKPALFKIDWDSLHWGRLQIKDGRWIYVNYIYWWNWLQKGYRYLGPHHIWYDCPHYSFGLWFINISWDFEWCEWHGDDPNWGLPWINQYKPEPEENKDAE